MIRRYLSLTGPQRMPLILLASFLAIGFYLRLDMALHISYTGLYQGTGFGHDEYHYVEMAKNLLKNGVYGYWGGKDAYVTPGYPLFVTVVFAVFGTGEAGLLAVNVIQALLSAFSAALIFSLSYRITKKYAIALMAAFLMAFYPALMFYSRNILTETLYIFMFLLYFNIQIIALEKRRVILTITAGALFAAAVLIRPMAVVLLPLPYIYMYMKDRDKLRLKELLYFAGGFIVIMIPWWVRNLIALGKFIPLATQGNPLYAGIVENVENLPPVKDEFSAAINLFKQEITNRTWQTIRWFTVGKFQATFMQRAYILPEGAHFLARAAYSAIHLAIMALGFFGLFLAMLYKKMRLTAVYTLLYILLSFIFIPTSRFALQYVPFLCMFSAFTVDLLYRKIVEDVKMEAEHGA